VAVVIRKLPRQARWAVPAGAVVAVALVAAGSALAGAQAAPQLPARSTAQLLAAVDAPPALPSAMQAVVQETANLGLPDLPGSAASDPLSGLSLLSGSHTFRIWYDGPSRVRIAIPVTLGEADLRRDGRNVWLWDSKTSQATHYVLPAGSAGTPDQTTPTQNAPTPQQVARQILAAVGATTTVGLEPSVMVAGQAAYQLSLAPKDSRSLIGQVRIAIDARYSLPLRVQVFARGASSPALQVGYTSLSFSRPAASNFPFTPPPGAKVKTITVPAAGSLAPGLPFPGLPAAAAGAGSQTIITDQGSNGGGFYNVRWGDGKVQPAKLLPATVVLPSGTTCAHQPRIPQAELKQMQAQLAAQLPKGMPKAQRAAMLKSIEASFSGAAKGSCDSVSAAVPAGQGQVSVGVAWASSPSPMTGPRVMGKDWLSVVVLPADASGLGGALLSAARPVHGSWGSGRLLRTSLVSVLITDSGQVLVGAVQPAVLYADAAQLR
jgi:outer membrane lipoprotein-sorting protein